MPRLVDRTGQRFNDWTFVKRLPNRGGKNTLWLCRCICGTERAQTTAKVLSGLTKGCGCNKGERISKAITKHGAAKSKVGQPSPEYRSWYQMRSRCRQKSDVSFKNYGARGIGVCERWNNFEAFLEDMGQRPSLKHSLHRIDNDKSYEPGNVEWATMTVQRSNTRNTIWVELEGQKMCLGHACDKLGRNRYMVYARVKSGMSVYEALLK